jgi:hypothetical protein
MKWRTRKGLKWVEGNERVEKHFASVKNSDQKTPVEIEL